MPYVESTHIDQTNFLASGRFQSFTEYVDNTNAAVTTDDRGRKVIPAGTIFLQTMQLPKVSRSMKLM